MKHLKTFMIVVIMFIVAISLSACKTTANTSNIDSTDTIADGGENKEDESNISSDDHGNGTPGVEENTGNGGNEAEMPEPSDKDGINILVVYFSCTNNTKSRAETLQVRLDADIYPIVPEVPYTSSDLNYNNNSCRANQEQRDANCRPEIHGRVENME